MLLPPTELVRMLLVLVGELGVMDVLWIMLGDKFVVLNIKKIIFFIDFIVQMISLTDATLLAQADDAVVILDKELVELYLMPFLPAISLEVSVKAEKHFF